MSCLNQALTKYLNNNVQNGYVVQNVIDGINAATSTYASESSPDTIITVIDSFYGCVEKQASRATEQLSVAIIGAVIYASLIIFIVSILIILAVVNLRGLELAVALLVIIIILGVLMYSIYRSSSNEITEVFARRSKALQLCINEAEDQVASIEAQDAKALDRALCSYVSAGLQ